MKCSKCMEEVNLCTECSKVLNEKEFYHVPFRLDGEYFPLHFCSRECALKANDRNVIYFVTSYDIAKFNDIVNETGGY